MAVKLDKCRMGPDGTQKAFCNGFQLLQENKTLGVFNCTGLRNLACLTAGTDNKAFIHVSLNFCPSCGASLRPPEKKRTRKKPTLPPVGTQLPMTFGRKVR
jgi:hypothetical protein